MTCNPQQRSDSLCITGYECVVLSAGWKQAKWNCGHTQNNYIQTFKSCVAVFLQIPVCADCALLVGLGMFEGSLPLLSFVQDNPGCCLEARLARLCLYHCLVSTPVWLASNPQVNHKGEHRARQAINFRESIHIPSTITQLSCLPHQNLQFPQASLTCLVLCFSSSSTAKLVSASSGLIKLL